MSESSVSSDAGEMSLLEQMLLLNARAQLLGNSAQLSANEPQARVKTVPLPSKRKSGQTIRSEARCIIANVIKYFEDEAYSTEPLFPIYRPAERAAAAVGVSVSTVKRIKKNGSLDPEHPTPGKSRPHDTIVQLTDLQKCVLRNTVHEFYTVQKQVPTVSYLANAMREKAKYNGSVSSLRRALVAIGFKWRRSAIKGKIMVEKSEVVIKRSHYLRTLKRYRAENRPIVFIDETWVSTNMKIGKCWQSEEMAIITPKSSGEKIVFIHAGGEQGFVPGAQLHFRSNSQHGDYHGEMTKELFMKWITEKLVPNLPANSVLVMDNAPYHNVVLNKPPSSASNKRQIQDWLTRRGILYGEDFRIPELLQLVKRHKEYVRYEVDEMVCQHGHTVLRLPPYHCDLNPIEYVWNEVKQFDKVDKVPNGENKLIDILDMTKKAFNSTLQRWDTLCRQVKDLESEYWHRDGLLDDLQHSVVNLESDNSDSESSSSDS